MVGAFVCPVVLALVDTSKGPAKKETVTWGPKCLHLRYEHDLPESVFPVFLLCREC